MGETSEENEQIIQRVVLKELFESGVGVKFRLVDHR